MKNDRARLKRMLKRDWGMDDPRRPVWLEATDSFYKKLNRIARECRLSRYEALSRGLDALLREDQVRNSALNRKHQESCAVGSLSPNHGTSLP